MNEARIGPKRECEKKPSENTKKLADSWKVVLVLLGSAGEVWDYCRKRFVEIRGRLITRELLTGRNSIN